VEHQGHRTYLRIRKLRIPMSSNRIERAIAAHAGPVGSVINSGKTNPTLHLLWCPGTLSETSRAQILRRTGLHRGKGP
jgi:hypothetical protein